WYVLCSNILGGCRGTTGPGSIRPGTNRPWAKDFPTITVQDMVDVQKALVDSLGIQKLRAVVGGSLGGHQTMTWATRYPDSLQTSVVVGSSPRLTAQALSFEVVARNAIQTDPHFQNGDYYGSPEQPRTGLAIARMLGHITYLSSEAMAQKFDVDRNSPRDIATGFEKRFSVGSYLAYQGQKFTERFDANSYCTISMALSLVDFGSTPAELENTFRESSCDWVVISFSSDWLFPPTQSRQIVAALTALGRRVSYCEVPTTAGHDGFLLSQEISAYGPLVSAKLGEAQPQAPRPHRQDAAILNMISAGASVLDLGCGDGHLLAALKTRGHQRLCGVDVKTSKLVVTAQHGVDVIDADLNLGLPEFQDDQFDIVVISSTLQLVPNVKALLKDSLRVGKELILAFPNFAWQPLREMFSEEGRSPKTAGDYGFQWYDTPNRRFPSIRDVEELIKKLELNIIESHYEAEGAPLSAEQLKDPNLFAEFAVLRISSENPIGGLSRP
ncbi:MAG: homoserine O-acetyltransferase, partial [Polyangiaceae bacterium]|nr:homoserine O-acetyltransferase [Polyangiaceae bacterium]